MSSYYGWVYDTVWSLAVGLNNSLQHLNESRLHQFTNNPYYLQAILGGMYDVNFQGVSVSFYEPKNKETPFVRTAARNAVGNKNEV